MFIDTLNAMSRDLLKHKREKTSIMQEAIANRLDKALESYSHDLNIKCEYLRHRDNLKLINKINRST